LSAAAQAAFLAALSAAGKAQFDAWSKAAEAVHKRNYHKIAGIQNL
jgi:hypothetical protein